MKVIDIIKNEIDKKSSISDSTFLLMIENIGNIDSALRDEVIYGGWYDLLIDNKRLTIDQKKFLLNYIFENKLLFYGIDKEKSDDVFTRSFTSLLLVLLLENHYEENWISKEEEIRIIEKSISYMKTEKDNRGFVEVKGWAHAFAHGADLLGVISQSTYFEKNNSIEVLEIMKRALIDIENFLYGEEGRFAKATTLLAKNSEISIGELALWIEKISNDLLNNNMSNICWKNYVSFVLISFRIEKLLNDEIENKIMNYLEKFYLKYGCL